MDERIEYAGFWIRVVATFIDAFLISLVTLPILYFVYGPTYFESDEMFAGGVDVLLSWVFPVVAVIAFWALKSATPGKMAFSAIIVDARTGAKPSVPQFIARYFCYIIAALPLLLGIIWVGIDRRKQGWHDKIAGTVVIRQRRPPVTFDR